MLARIRPRPDYVTHEHRRAGRALLHLIVLVLATVLAIVVLTGCVSAREGDAVSALVEGVTAGTWLIILLHDIITKKKPLSTLASATIALAFLMMGCSGEPVCLDRGIAGPLAVIAGVGLAYLGLGAVIHFFGPRIMRWLTGLR